MSDYTISIAGDSALNIEFGDAITPETSAVIRLAAHTLTEDAIPGVRELIPTFCSLMVSYDPVKIGYAELCDRLAGKLRSIGPVDMGIRKITVIPVCYDGDFGPDMHNVIDHTGLSREEVIELHSKPDYLIDMLGFLPGFAYLGGLDERLHTPRLAVPRTCIEAGSVGIGGEQTGIYPLDSPGGWQIIGRTPVRPYDPDREEPIIYAAGEYLRFKPITIDEYHVIEQKVVAGDYSCKTIMEED